MSEPTRTTRTTRGPCPVCRAPSEARWRPFCSKRCADIDLGRWVSGSYRIPGEPAPEVSLGSGSGDGESREDE